MKLPALALCALLLTSCSQSTFSYHGGKMVKEPRPRPTKGYSIGLVFSIGLGEQYKIKH